MVRLWVQIEAWVSQRAPEDPLAEGHERFPGPVCKGTNGRDADLLHLGLALGSIAVVLGFVQR